MIYIDIVSSLLNVIVSSLSEGFGVDFRLELSDGFGVDFRIELSDGFGVDFRIELSEGFGVDFSHPATFLKVFRLFLFKCLSPLV